MKYINKILTNKPKPVYFLLGFISLLVLYVLYLFFYLKIVGVYAVAVIKEAVPTSGGIDYMYEFFYEDESYTGVFSGMGGYKIGDKYFVSFSRNNPGKNLLQYDHPVPHCFKDSFSSFWSTYPKCPSDTSVGSTIQ